MTSCPLFLGAVFLLGGGDGVPVRTESWKLTAPEAAAGDIHGAALDVQGRRAVIANEYDDTQGEDSGSVFVHEFLGPEAGWGATVKLLPEDGSRQANFGRAVAIRGDRIAVGAHWDSTGPGRRAGAAYVFRRAEEGWVQEQKLTPKDLAPGDRFGVHLWLDGPRLIVGAWQADGPHRDSGAAYLFRRREQGWEEEQRLTVPDAGAGDNLGRFTCLEGDVAVVGAWGDDDRGRDAGAAYVFRELDGHWRPVQKLGPRAGSVRGRFGWVGSLEGGLLAIGAWRESAPGLPDAGAVYLYRWEEDRFREVGHLRAPTPAQGARFGTSVSVSGGRLLVGAQHADGRGPGTGAAWLFSWQEDRWSPVAELHASDGAAEDLFGCMVALSGPHALVGAWRDDDAGEDSGAAYAFQQQGD